MYNLSPSHLTLKVFDLKGSMRSRYVDPSKDRSGNVLLDENYLNCKSPLVGKKRLSMCLTSTKPTRHLDFIYFLLPMPN